MSKSSSLKKNAAYNVIKTLFSIIFPLITFPYATRVLSTSNYGKYTFSNSIISYITLIAGLGIKTYSLRTGAKVRSNKQQCGKFIDEVFTINIYSTFLAYLILGALLIFWTKIHDYTSIVIVLSTSVLFTTLGTDWINMLYEDYEFITKRYILCQSLSLLCMFLIVRGPEDVVQYAIVSIVGSVSANIINIFYIRKRLGIRVHFVKSFERLKPHFVPILILFATAVVINIYINSDTTILGILRSDTDVAIYGVASKIYSLVKQVINAIAMVAISRMSIFVAKNMKCKMEKELSEILETVLLIVCPAIIGLLSLRFQIIGIISGKAYYDGAMPLAILSFALLFATCANVFVNLILIPYRKEKLSLIILSISALINIVLNFFLIPDYGCSAAAFTTLLSELFVFICGGAAARKYVKIKIGRSIGFSFMGAGIALAICELSKRLFDSDFKICGFSIVLTIIIYITLLLILKHNIVYDTIVEKLGSKYM